MQTPACPALLVVLLTACAGPATIPGTTGSPPEVTPAGVPAAQCRLSDVQGGGVHLGAPRSTDRLPSSGPVRAAVLFGAYTDVTPERSPQEVFDLLSPGTEAAFLEMSYGRFQLQLVPHLTWLPLSGPASHYADAIRTFAAHKDFLEEAVRLADTDVDFSKTDLVVLMGPPSAKAVAYGPTWLGFDALGGHIEADGRRITNGITSGADVLFWGHLWLNHEMGHSLSLPDLYSFTESTGFTRPFGLMDLINASAPGYLAYERWHLGWLDDAQVVCDAFDTDLLLTPLHAAGGTKAAMVQLPGDRVLVVESRRAEGLDAALQDAGAVAYVVDTAVASGSGPIRVLNQQRSLKAGESVVFEGVTVQVLTSTDAGDTVRVLAAP